ncbi:hypothetical protein [Ornithinimicrobium cavernae]|uniref:hypothetical protein n=1 Tax=Ornithinimicrobium cavernae TaxID=2666047 RepID=UPI0012B182C9|nr:hypothetical protein [Ornithinimicrobium cavernae]
MAQGEKTSGGPTRALGALGALCAVAGLVLLGLGLFGVLNTATPNMTGINSGQSVRIPDSGMSLWAEEDVRNDVVCRVGDDVMERPTSTYSVDVGDREFFEVARTPSGLEADSYVVTCEGTDAGVYVGPNAARTSAPGLIGQLGLVLGGILLGLAVLLGLGALLTRSKEPKPVETPYQYSSYGTPPAAGGYPSQPYADPHQSSYPPSPYGQDQTQAYPPASYGQDQTQAYPPAGGYGQSGYGQSGYTQGGYGQQAGYGEQPYGTGQQGQGYGEQPYGYPQGQGYGQEDQTQAYPPVAGYGSTGYGQYGADQQQADGDRDQTEAYGTPQEQGQPYSQQQYGSDQPSSGGGATAWTPGQTTPEQPAPARSPYSDIPPPPGYGTGHPEPGSAADSGTDPDTDDDGATGADGDQSAEDPLDDDQRTQQFPPPPPRWDNS